MSSTAPSPIPRRPVVALLALCVVATVATGFTVAAADGAFDGRASATGAFAGASAAGPPAGPDGAGPNPSAAVGECDPNREIAENRNTGPREGTSSDLGSNATNRTLVVAATDPDPADEADLATDPDPANGVNPADDADPATGEGDRLLAVPVAEGDEVTLAYTHSVEKTPVRDVYVVNGTELRMDRTVFSSFGAGLPSEADANRTEDGFVVSVDRSFDRLYVSPGSIAGHELRIGDGCIDLVERTGGAAVVLFVVERPASDPSGG